MSQGEYINPFEEAPAGEDALVAYTREFIENDRFLELINMFNIHTLGAANLARFRETAGEESFTRLRHSSNDIEFAREQAQPPRLILPFLRRSEDLLGQDLIIGIRGGRDLNLVTIPSASVIGHEDGWTLELSTEDPHLRLITTVDSPTLITRRDFELITRERVGSGHKGFGGLYWRLVLLDTVLRHHHLDAADIMTKNVQSFARKCGLQLAPERKVLSDKYLR